MKQSILTILIIGLISNISLSQSTTSNFTSEQLIIKTIVAKGSLRENEFGKQADWIEIYNNGDQDINLGDHKWYLSDNPKRPKKFKLPKQIIKAKSTLVVWCDDINRVKKEIHTNFKLSSYGETIVLSCKMDNEITEVDTVTYAPLQKNEQMAICRTDDGLVYKQIQK